MSLLRYGAIMPPMRLTEREGYPTGYLSPWYEWTEVGERPLYFEGHWNGSAVVPLEQWDGRQIPTAISDSFNRDNSTNLGATTTGESWVKDIGAWDIYSTQAQTLDFTARAMISVDFGVADMRVQATLNYTGSGSAQAGVIGRYTSGGSYYMAAVNTAAVFIHKWTGSWAQLGTTAMSNTHPTVIALSCKGNQIQAFVDGSLALTVTDSSITTGTRAGIANYTGRQGNRFDDFSVTSP